MNLIEIFQDSIDVLRVNRMRTILSTLGIIIGIGSVIALMGLGVSSKQNIKTQIQSLGTNLLTIRPGAQRQGGDFLRSSSDTKTLLYSDAKAIEDTDMITTIDKVASDYISRSQVSYGKNNANKQIFGITNNYFEVRNMKLEYGATFSQENEEISEKVAILGADVVSDLFSEGENPIGKKVRIQGISFEVVGVIESKEGFNSPNDYVFIPLLTAQRAIYGTNYLSNIYVSAKDESVMEDARNQIGFMLLELHNLKSPDQADFSISSQEDILSTITQVTSTFTTLLTGIAAISLIVGGIGIMNIMLVTVTERTSEIGLRKSLGAKKKIIIYQFLTESIVLTFVGGILGIFIGVAVSYGITKYMSLPFVISYYSIGIAVIVSCAIGIIFGLYPAFRASKLQPIEALRYE